LTKRSIKKHYKKVAGLKGGLQRKDYFFEELEKLREEIRKKQEKEKENE